MVRGGLGECGAFGVRAAGARVRRGGGRARFTVRDSCPGRADRTGVAAHQGEHGKARCLCGEPQRERSAHKGTGRARESRADVPHAVRAGRRGERLCGAPGQGTRRSSQDHGGDAAAAHRGRREVAAAVPHGTWQRLRQPPSVPRRPRHAYSGERHDPSRHLSRV